MTQDFTYHYIEEGKEQEPLSMDKMRDIAERIFVASAPWQEWYLHVRSVYRWEDPYETFRWFLLYVVLWYYQRIGAFLVSPSPPFLYFPSALPIPTPLPPLVYIHPYIDQKRKEKNTYI